MRLRSLFFAVLLLLAHFSAPLRPSSSRRPPAALVALDRELRMLGHDKRVLMIGAHPDDEDTELLTVLVRGMGAEAAYLSLNRGEGGQNLIGPELGEALGLIRTEELLAARRLDGARQFFTRAYDFGYSKTLDETWQPLAAGHGPQGRRADRSGAFGRRSSSRSSAARRGTATASTRRRAGRRGRRFAAAGDSSRFPELAREEGLAPWTPLKLYRSTGSTPRPRP